MSLESFNKIMEYLDIIEKELNKIAEINGHEDFNTWLIRKNKSN